ncbi:MAG: biotin--[acetyl-CoA-carboxylase] ligase [bacterium]|nr:biotin--[acetyl-CoA-carboxylase] ligase [bacterium]
MTAKIKPNTQIIGQNLVYFARLDSTNHLAMEMHKNQIIENGTIIYTDEQTHGRGQQQKVWESAPYENLLFSILLKPVTNYSANPFTLNKCITMALCNFLKEQLPSAKVNIKWPNDLMVNNKKIAGVLIENIFSGQQLSASVVGVGMNINQQFGNHSNLTATSFADIKNETVDRWMLFQQLIEKIDAYYLNMLDGDLSGIENEFNESLIGYHETVAFEIDNQVVYAQIEGCDADGRLMISHSNVLKAYQHGGIKQLIKA